MNKKIFEDFINDFNYHVVDQYETIEQLLQREIISVKEYQKLKNHGLSNILWITSNFARFDRNGLGKSLHATVLRLNSHCFLSLDEAIEYILKKDINNLEQLDKEAFVKDSEEHNYLLKILSKILTDKVGKTAHTFISLNSAVETQIDIDNTVGLLKKMTLDKRSDWAIWDKSERGKVRGQIFNKIDELNHFHHSKFSHNEFNHLHNSYNNIDTNL